MHIFATSIGSTVSAKNSTFSENIVKTLNSYIEINKALIFPDCLLKLRISEKHAEILHTMTQRIKLEVGFAAATNPFSEQDFSEQVIQGWMKM